MSERGGVHFGRFEWAIILFFGASLALNLILWDQLTLLIEHTGDVYDFGGNYPTNPVDSTEFYPTGVD